MDSRSVIQSYILDKSEVKADMANLLEVLKYVLTDENRGHISSKVNECNSISLSILSLDSVQLGSVEHYARIEPRQPHSPTDGPIVTGVVVHSNGVYRIVDGYHRLKFSRLRNESSGLFIVLEKTIVTP